MSISFLAFPCFFYSNKGQTPLSVPAIMTHSSCLALLYNPAVLSLFRLCSLLVRNPFLIYSNFVLFLGIFYSFSFTWQKNCVNVMLKGIVVGEVKPYWVSEM
jgi:hypothetical protein